MRKLAVLPAALVAAAVVAAPAAAQVPVTEFTSKASISPKKAGTKKNPRGVQLKGSLGFRTITPGIEEPIITGGDILIAKGGVWGGGKYATCSGAKMRKAQSTDVCPAKSIVGSGEGVAFADTTDAAPDVVFVNGGKSTLWAFTTLYNPAIVQEPVQIKIKKQSGKWAYKASFRVPKVLQVVAGVPITLRSLNYKIGGKFKLPNGKTVNASKHAPQLLATTSCPKSNKYPYQATAHYLYNTGQTASRPFKGTVACS
ncbi:MAG TPA: hypothetical protein VEW67_03380 [Thermoleophilaceae bacterium]|nr:hypothetical protein [Thermoleophilaceae bacterium]